MPPTPRTFSTRYVPVRPSSSSRSGGRNSPERSGVSLSCLAFSQLKPVSWSGALREIVSQGDDFGDFLVTKICDEGVGRCADVLDCFMTPRTFIQMLRNKIGLIMRKTPVHQPQQIGGTRMPRFVDHAWHFSDGISPWGIDSELAYPIMVFVPYHNWDRPNRTCHNGRCPTVVKPQSLAGWMIRSSRRRVSFSLTGRSRMVRPSRDTVVGRGH